MMMDPSHSKFLIQIKAIIISTTALSLNKSLQTECFQINLT